MLALGHYTRDGYQHISEAYPVPVRRPVLTAEIVVETAGENGAAGGSAASEALEGVLVDLQVAYAGTSPASTNVSVDLAPYTEHALTRLATNTGGVFPVLRGACDNTGGALADVYEPYVLGGAVTVAVTACNAAADAVTVKVRYVPA